LGVEPALSRHIGPFDDDDKNSDDEDEESMAMDTLRGGTSSPSGGAPSAATDGNASASNARGSVGTRAHMDRQRI
jgi:hypothetical protein